ncbi:ADP-ribosylation factor-related protein 1 [Hordeum vulgare]|nr:ADP-ribosylation factor-related protein 1 [Hordeum vulgare]
MELRPQGHPRLRGWLIVRTPPPRQAAPPFSIAPRPAGHRDRQYLSVEVCWRYSETRTPVPWSYVHLPNAWHLSADRVPIPPVPTSGRVRREEIDRRHRLLPDDLYYGPRYAADNTLWDTWLRDEHNVRRASYFAGTVAGPWRAREVRGRTRVHGLTPTSSPSPSPSPPPPPRMTEEQEARLIQRVMEDSMTTHDERQWRGLDRAMALSAAGDVAIPEPMEEEELVAFPPGLVGTSWGWSSTAPEMAQAVGAVNWCPMPPQSREREASPREEVLQASFEHAPAHQGPPAHLWTPPPYDDLISDGDDDDTGDQ